MSRPDIRFYILSSLFTALTAVGAFIRIPLFFVPFTLQDFFVILSGCVLGPVFGATSQLLYLIIGLSGAPIFAHGGGPAYVLQPTFGYLLGFPVAAFLVGYIIWGKNKPDAAHPPSFSRILFANSTGLLVVFALGVLFLYLNLKFVVAKPISLSAALWTGCIVFIPGSILKIIASSFLTPKLAHIFS